MPFSRLTLSQYLVAILAGTLLLLATFSVLMDHKDRLAMNKGAVMSDGLMSITKIAPVIFNLPEAQRAPIARALSGMERQFFWSDSRGLAPEDIRDPEVEQQLLAWVQRHDLPIDAVVVAQREIDMILPAPRGLAEQRSPLLAVGEAPRVWLPENPGNIPPWAHVDAAPDAPKPPVAVPTSRVEAVVAVLGVRHKPSGHWLTLQFFRQPPQSNVTYSKLGVSLLAALALSLVVALAGRRIMRPFRALAKSAEVLSRGEKAEAVAVEGPRDLRDIIRAFNKMNARVSQSIDYQIGLLHSLGHDLAGPLASAGRLLNGVEPETARQEVQHHLSRAEDLVQSIMQFSRAVMRDGKLEPVDLGSLLETVVHEKLDQGADASVTVEDNVVVQCRANATWRCVQNLVENALKYGGNVSASLYTDGDMAVTAIEDDGPGIPPANMAAVFEPFHRLDEDSPGSGLGLAIVRTIAIDHGGSITLSNRKTGGLRAELRLPLLVS
jgi:signal transduction histidine kinase